MVSRGRSFHVCSNNYDQLRIGKLLVRGLEILHSEEALFCKGNLCHLMWLYAQGPLTASDEDAEAWICIWVFLVFSDL